MTDDKNRENEEYLANLTFGQRYSYLVSLDYWCGIYESLAIGLNLLAPVLVPILFFAFVLALIF